MGARGLFLRTSARVSDCARMALPSIWLTFGERRIPEISKTHAKSHRRIFAAITDRNGSDAGVLTSAARRFAWESLLMVTAQVQAGMGRLESSRIAREAQAAGRRNPPSAMGGGLDYAGVLKSTPGARGDLRATCRRMREWGPRCVGCFGRDAFWRSLPVSAIGKIGAASAGIRSGPRYAQSMGGGAGIRAPLL